MIGRTNAGGGSAYAVIDVSYPEGAVCTCTNGTRTMQAKDSSGRWMFQIPRAGEWTVTAEKDGDSKSGTIEVEEGKVYSLKLLFAFLLFDNGAEVPWKAYNEPGKPTSVVIGEESINFNAIVGYKSAATTNSYDMTPYKTAHLTGNVNEVYSTDYPNIPRFMVTDNVYTENNYGLAHKTFSNTGPVSIDLDISNITGSHKIEIWGTFYGNITKVWLTED